MGMFVPGNVVGSSPVGIDSMTLEDRDALIALIQTTIREELKDHCRLPITDTEAKQASHVFGVLSDLGDGKLESGIEVTRENHKWLKQVRERSNTASAILFGLVILTVGGGLLSALWMGLKSLLVGGGGGSGN